VYYSKGVLATNARLVERIAGLARAFGRELATLEDVKRIWAGG
jgi:3-keto-5-aminohexanoate cleavage enzyme